MENSAAQAIGFFGYMFTFPLGFVGHTFSLITFSSKTLRVTSTGFLFICLTISDILYQLMSIHDFIVQTLQVSTLKNGYICRLRTFILNFSAFTSAWILVLINMEQAVRVCFPDQQGRLCKRKLAALLVSIVCVCSITSTCHVLQSELIYSNLTGFLCGPDRFTLTPYTIFYYNIWPILQLIIIYFIPSCLMIISIICVRIKLRAQQKQFVKSIKKERLQQQMLILMISSIISFSIFTFYYSLHRIMYQQFGSNSVTSIEMAILTNFLNMIYCYNFYIHCLTSNLFREIFIEQFKRIFLCWKRQINKEIYPLAKINRPYN